MTNEVLDPFAAGRLDGRVAFITGSAAGMGWAHARLLAARGARVVIQDIDAAGAQGRAEELLSSGADALAVGYDIADVSASKKAVAGVEAKWGSVDILINNAGIGGKGAKFEDIDQELLQRMFSVHVSGHFFLTQLVVPAMKEQRRGKIINVSSRWALTGAAEAPHYIACKAALLGLTKSWALELAPWNIQVNALAPGGVWTDMVRLARGEDFIRAEEKKVPLGRWAEAEEYAYAAAFLASSESDFMTGQTLSPNGGASIVGG